MKTRLFVMLSLAGLTGVLAGSAAAGCSSEPTGVEPIEAGTSDAPLDVKKVPLEAAPEEMPEAGPETCPPTTPILAADLTKWQPPGPIQDVCTQENVDALKAAFTASTTGSVKFTDIKTALGAACSGCVFSPLNNDAGATPNWSVFVETGTGAFDNRTASCFARLKDETCGRTRSQFEFCLRLACKMPDCATDADVKTCKTKVQSGACKAITDAYVAACPNESQLLDACNLYASIADSCSGGADAGIDAASP
jgi:hypothetical protein